MRRTIRGAATVLLLACVILLTSCMGPREERLPETGATLEGTVKYRGAPVPFAVVFVQGPDKISQAKVNEDGTYKVENVPLGPVNIGVNSDAARGDYQSKTMSQAYKGPDAKGRASTKLRPFVNVPKKYFDPTQSGIKTTIKEGVNQFPIDLQ